MMAGIGEQVMFFMREELENYRVMVQHDISQGPEYCRDQMRAYSDALRETHDDVVTRHFSILYNLLRQRLVALRSSLIVALAACDNPINIWLITECLVATDAAINFRDELRDTIDASFDAPVASTDKPLEPIDIALAMCLSREALSCDNTNCPICYEMCSDRTVGVASESKSACVHVSESSSKCKLDSTSVSVSASASVSVSAFASVSESASVSVSESASDSTSKSDFVRVLEPSFKCELETSLKSESDSNPVHVLESSSKCILEDKSKLQRIICFPCGNTHEPMHISCFEVLASNSSRCPFCRIETTPELITQLVSEKYNHKSVVEKVVDECGANKDTIVGVQSIIDNLITGKKLDINKFKSLPKYSCILSFKEMFTAIGFKFCDDTFVFLPDDAKPVAELFKMALEKALL